MRIVWKHMQLPGRYPMSRRDMGEEHFNALYSDARGALIPWRNVAWVPGIYFWIDTACKPDLRALRDRYGRMFENTSEGLLVSCDKTLKVPVLVSVTGPRNVGFKGLGVVDEREWVYILA